MATLGATRRDPYRNFNFIVEIDGFDVAGFTSVKGLEQSTDPIEYREGGDNATPRKLIGKTKFSDITLTKGMSSDAVFYTWASAVFNIAADVIPEAAVKHFVTIKQLDKTKKEVKVWQVMNCWPVRYAPGDLDAMGNEVAIETIVLANEGFLLTKSV